MPDVPDYLSQRRLSAECVTHKHLFDLECPWCAMRMLVSCTAEPGSCAPRWAILQDHLATLRLFPGYSGEAQYLFWY